MVSPSAAMDASDRKPASSAPELKPSARSEREDRLAKALRDNLRRRKAPPKPGAAGSDAD
jgi:hypothetical protein